jgi:type IX secretion system PorP/SprF family membrane protein
MRYIPFIGILAIVSLSSMVRAQDAHFSQFYSNPIYLAPSFAGSSHSTRFVGAFRDQWPKIPGNFINYSFSVDHYVPKLKSGFAFLASTDNAGSGKLVTSNISFGYSYNVKLTRKLFFQPGLAAYYYSRKIDYTEVTFSDEYFMNQYVGSTSENLSYDKVQHADFAVSSLLYTYNFWLGFNFDHLMTLSPVLRSDIKYSDMRLSVFGGYKFKIHHRTRNKYNEYIHAAFNYRMQSGIHQMDIGGYYNRQPIMIGLWYRGIPLLNEYATSSAIVYLFGFKYKDYIFSYSFDMSLGNLISQTGGSHEITISYFIVKSSRPKKYKAIPCPEM